MALHSVEMEMLVDR